MLARMQEMLVRFLGVVQAAHVSFIDADQFEVRIDSGYLRLPNAHVSFIDADQFESWA